MPRILTLPHLAAALVTIALPVAHAQAPVQPADNQTIHLIVGHSLSLTTPRPLTRVYVTNPTVLDSYTASPTQVLVTAKQPGLSSAVLWDESGDFRSYLISSDLDTTDLNSTLHQAYPNASLTVAANQDHLTLSGTLHSQDDADSALKLAALYSKQVSSALTVNTAGARQVKLRVRIVEIDRARLEQFGFNFFSTGGNNLAGTTTTQFPSSITTTPGSAGTAPTVSVSNALNFLFYSSKLHVGATIQDLENKQILQILAEPTITALSGQKASFLAGGEFPFPVVQGSTGGLTSITVQFRPYGVKLDFLPIVNPDSSIQLKVSPEVSALDYTNAVQINGYTIPALSTRRAETLVVVPAGQSFVISGLLDKRTTDAFGRTPGIASIPILGKLFTSKNVNHSTTELLVIVTPELVDPLITPQTPIVEPKMVIPTLDPPAFDSHLPAGTHGSR